MIISTNDMVRIPKIDNKLVRIEACSPDMFDIEFKQWAPLNPN